MLINITYQPNKPVPLTDFLTSIYIPRKTKHFLRMQKRVTVNKTIVPFHHLVTKGDQITINFDDNLYEQPHILLGDATKIKPLYEDEHLIIVNKPIHLKTHPNEPTENYTLLNNLAAYLQPQKQIPYVVHRLDMETSGCVLFAKNPIVLPILSRMLENKEINRTYEAIVQGNLNKDLTINKPIGRHPNDQRKRSIDFKKGQKAITHVQILKSEKNHTRIECHLETGRTHQIRVHLASIQHPILGDPLYNNIHDQRLFLHAKKLNFTHPFTKKPIETSSKVPF